MGLETATYINDLNSANPVGATDPKSQGDDHIRLIKAAVQATFPGMAGKAWRAQTKSAGYTVIATDNMTVFNCTAALTLSITAAATLGNGFLFGVRANGGAVIIDPNSSELVNGAATVTVPDGTTDLFFCDGSVLFSLNALTRTMVDAKGDLLVGTADNVITRKAVGSDGGILTADSTQSDGLVWALPVFGFKNRIINGFIDVSQRAAVNTFTNIGTGTAGTFGPDMWWGYTGTSGLWKIGQVTTGVTDFPKALRIQRIAGQTSTSAVYFGQTLENSRCVDLSGQQVTISFYATAGANYSGGACTLQLLSGSVADEGTSSLNTGTWSSISTPINTTFTPTTTRTLIKATVTLGTVAELALRLNCSGSGTAGANDYIDITGVQLEIGGIATKFDLRPPALELILCQREYFQTAFGTTRYGCARQVTDVSEGRYLYADFPVQMRAAPTVAITGDAVTSQVTSVNGVTWVWSSIAANSAVGISAYTAAAPL